MDQESTSPIIPSAPVTPTDDYEKIGAEIERRFREQKLTQEWAFRGGAISKRFAEIDRATEKIMKSAFITPVSPLTPTVVKMLHQYSAMFREIGDELDAFYTKHKPEEPPNES